MSEFGLTLNRTRKDGSRYKQTYKPRLARPITKKVVALATAIGLAAEGGHLAYDAIQGNVSAPANPIAGIKGNDNPPVRKPLEINAQSSLQLNQKVEPTPTARPPEPTPTATPQKVEQKTGQPAVQLVINANTPQEAAKIAAMLGQNVTVQQPAEVKPSPATSPATKPSTAPSAPPSAAPKPAGR